MLALPVFAYEDFGDIGGLSYRAQSSRSIPQI